jgi:hypothetical protein
VFENWPDARFRELTREVLASLSADDVGSAIVQHVELRVAAKGEETRDDIVLGLPIGTKAIYTTWLVDVDVNNGGFNQFFFNPSGKFAGIALGGYELLGAEEYAAIMRAAIATYESERDVIAPYRDAGTLEAFRESYRHTKLDEVDQRYYALGDRIYEAWADFVRRRPELFAG